ncbi:MAG: hypothetical protein PUK39_02310 [Clostridiales bacterium]|nr:hypothetical protein [Clostridiales bacterium]
MENMRFYTRKNIMAQAMQKSNVRTLEIRDRRAAESKAAIPSGMAACGRMDQASFCSAP